MQFLGEFHAIFKRVSHYYIQSQVSNNKATSGSQISHKYITHMPQVSNNKAINDSQICIAIEKWQTPID